MSKKHSVLIGKVLSVSPFSSALVPRPSLYHKVICLFTIYSFVLFLFFLFSFSSFFWGGRTV